MGILPLNWRTVGNWQNRSQQNSWNYAGPSSWFMRSGFNRSSYSVYRFTSMKASSCRDIIEKLVWQVLHPCCSWTLSSPNLSALADGICGWLEPVSDPHCNCINQIFTLERSLELRHTFDGQTIFVFFDLKAAFESFGCVILCRRNPSYHSSLCLRTAKAEFVLTAISRHGKWFAAVAFYHSFQLRHWNQNGNHSSIKWEKWYGHLLRP